VFSDPNVLVGVQSLTSADFSINWPGYNGIAGTGDTHLLTTGANSLAAGESGTLTLVVRVIPANNGPFENSATATGEPPEGVPVADVSQDGTNPDPEPSDSDPTNNNEPTPVNFGANLFDPPSGEKTVNAAGLPVLQWSMVWINDTNILAINARAVDELPEGTSFDDTGISSGYPLPGGVLPAGSTDTGVTCVAPGSTSTTTTYCYYEGPSTSYPRGRIIWEGTLGPDLGATNPETAINDIQISFNLAVENGVGRVENTATIDADQNGDGDVEDLGERFVATANENWTAADDLPDTGFAPDTVVKLPKQSMEKAYRLNGNLTLEIPRLNLSTTIVSVPLVDGKWDVTWLDNKAGHLMGTAYPTWNGNTILTGHNWSAFNQPGPFAELKQLQYGDVIKINAYGMTYTYEVRENTLVKPDDIDRVMQHEVYDWITLVTCESFTPTTGNYQSRRMVRAVLIDVE
jgi:LPXTG-site transpeptidase (sortase) family protein